jgi:CBS domain-containing protein
MTTVSQLLRTKGRDVWSVAPETTVYNALELMAEKNVGAVLVMSDERIAGIFSERDYARKVALKGKSSRSTPVREIMTKEVVVVEPDHTVQQCMTVMSDKRIRHLPVLASDGELAGIISIGDVVKTIITEQEVMINHLEGYITGKT